MESGVKTILSESLETRQYFHVGLPALAVCSFLIIVYIVAVFPTLIRDILLFGIGLCLLKRHVSIDVFPAPDGLEMLVCVGTLRGDE